MVDTAAAVVVSSSRSPCEAVAGALYLMSGVVFPIGVLPPCLQAVSLVLPTTYWLEGMRRALLGPTGLPSPLNAWGHGALANGDCIRNKMAGYLIQRTLPAPGTVCKAESRPY